MAAWPVHPLPKTISGRLAVEEGRRMKFLAGLLAVALADAFRSALRVIGLQTAALPTKTLLIARKMTQIWTSTASSRTKSRPTDLPTIVNAVLV
jgi:hypothetical protein